MAVFGLQSLQVFVPRQFVWVCHSVNMKWGVNKNHVAVTALQNCGKSCSQIFKLLKPLKISRMFIYRAIKCYEELWKVEDGAQSGCLKSLRAEATVKTVWERIHRNPLWKQKIMSQELNISTQSLSRLIRDDKHIRVHHRSKGRLLTPALKAIRWTRILCLLQWHAKNGHENIIFMDEKICTIGEQYNHQNQKIYAQMSCEVKENLLRVQGGHHPSYIMDWWEVSHQGVTNLHFCKKGVKLVSECIERMCYKLWNILTWPSSVVSSSRTQFLPKRPRQCRGGCGVTFWPSSAPRIGLRGAQTSNPWTINCGLFWRTWRAKNVTTAWTAWGDPPWDGACSNHKWLECLKACVKA